MNGTRYAIGFETGNGTKVLKTPRRNSLVFIGEGVRFKSFTKHSTAAKWVMKLKESGIPGFDELEVIPVPPEWCKKTPKKKQIENEEENEPENPETV